MPNFESNVKKNVNTWITGLMALSEEARNTIPDFDKLTAALFALKEVTLLQYDKQNLRKKMDDDSYKALADAYRKAGTLCEAYFELPQMNDEVTARVSGLLRGISADLAEDMNALEQYKSTVKSKEAVSFQTLIDRGHTREINIGNARVTRLGAAMSNRMVFHYRSPDGRDLNGVFTEKNFFDPEQMEKDDRAEYDKQYSEAMTLFSDVYSAYTEFGIGDKTLEGFYQFFPESPHPAENIRMKKYLVKHLQDYYTAHGDREKLALLNKHAALKGAFSDVFCRFQKQCEFLTSGAGRKAFPTWTELLKKTGEKHRFIKMVFENAYPAYLSANKKKDSAKSRLFFCNSIKPLNEGGPIMRRHDLLHMVQEYLRKENRTAEADKLADMCLDQDPDFAAMMESFRNHCDSIGNKINVSMGGAALSEHSRIDTRNTGMSLVADMLGRPELIAHAEPLKLTLGGKQIEGTFMALGRGLDLAKLKGYDVLEKYNNNTFKTNGIRSVSDLMVIDFICGNVDRHYHNMMYQFDMKGPASKHRFTGVQGIDNDDSFGNFDPAEDIETGQVRRMRFPYLDRIKVISRSMADHVLSLTAEELKFRLRGQSLTDSQLNAAGKRLNQLQQAIREGRTYYLTKKDRLKKNPALVVPGHLRIVPDEEFNKLDLAKLSDSDQSYYHVLNNFANMHTKADFRREKLTPEVVNSVYGSSISEEEVERISEQLKQMAEITAPGKTSGQFEQLRTVTENYQAFCIQHQNTLLSEDDRNAKAKYLKDITDAAHNYLNHKKHRIWTTDYAKKRIDLVTDMDREYAEISLAATSAVYGTESPELKQQVDEYNARTMELLDTRIVRKPEPSLKVDVQAPQAEKQKITKPVMQKQ